MSFKDYEFYFKVYKLVHLNIDLKNTKLLKNSKKK